MPKADSLRFDLHADALADAQGRRLVGYFDQAFESADVVEHERLDDAMSFFSEPVRHGFDAAFPYWSLEDVVLDVDFLTHEHHASPLLQHFGPDHLGAFG